MTPEKCPGCGVKLRRDMLACPNCPMSFPEDDGRPESVNPLKQSRYYQFVMPLLFFGAIGAVVWYLGVGLMRLGEKNAVVENGNIYGEVKGAAPTKTARTEDVPAERKAAAMAYTLPNTAMPSDTAAGARPAETPSVSDDDQGSVVITRVADSAPPRGTSSHAAASAAPTSDEPPKPVREWRLRGAVYDLTTLKPLAGAFLSFKDEQTNKEIMTRTDSSGHYRVVVPPLGEHGYAVTIERSGYAPNYLDPATQGVGQMPESRRRELAHGLAGTLGGASASVSAESERPLITDFYLAPRL